MSVVSDSGLPTSLSGLWFQPYGRSYIVGDGIYDAAVVNSSPVWRGSVNVITTYYTFAVRGNSVNDLFVVGSYGEVLHFNGSTWKSFREQTQLSYGSYTSVAVRGNLVIAVGYEGNRAVVARGRRQ